MTQAPHTLVIGGGVIGVASAHYLNAAGRRVTVVDQGRIGGACSHANCGLICPSHVAPLAEPGAIGAACKALLQPNGPFRIRPRLDWALWRWLWRFARRCNRSDMLESARAIQPLLTSSLDLYGRLIEGEGLDCEWQTAGLLFVYQDPKALDAYGRTNDWLTAEFNEPARRLDGEAARRYEPALVDGLAGAWLYEHDAHLRPDRLMSSWRRLLQRRGVRFIENVEFTSWRRTNSQVTAALLGGESIEADSFVVATGAWTPRLAPTLGRRLPIEPGKGYSITLPRPAVCPRVPLVLPEHRVVVTPLESAIRFGSIMELAGYDRRLPPRRLRLLSESARRFLRESPAQSPGEPWYGWRPMTYDSTPIIGRMPGLSNVFVATGHNMLGLSMAPATGRLIAELITGVEPHVRPKPYRVERFYERR